MTILRRLIFVFRDRGIELPLPSQATVGEADRYDQGRAIQFPIYGDEIRDNLAALPDRLGDDLARFLTEFCFGDFSTRTGLDLARRELLVLCLLATLGGTEAQLRAHALGNIKVGNDRARQITALIHCFPHIGFPRAELGPNQLRLVAMTGFGQSSDRDRALAAGFDSHLIKPARTDQIQRALKGDRHG